jgi:hypothetical protein
MTRLERSQTMFLACSLCSSSPFKASFFFSLCVLELTLADYSLCGAQTHTHWVQQPRKRVRDCRFHVPNIVFTKYTDQSFRFNLSSSTSEVRCERERDVQLRFAAAVDYTSFVKQSARHAANGRTALCRVPNTPPPTTSGSN